MKQVVKGMFVFALAIAMAAPLFGADEKKAEGKKKKEKAAPGAFLVKQAMGRLKNVDLSDEQEAKIKKIAAEWAPKMAELRKAAGLSKEQQQARREAMAKAKEAGKKGKELAAAANEAVKLTDDQKAGLEKMREASQAFNKAVMEVLTEEQRAKVGGKRKPKAKAKAAKADK